MRSRLLWALIGSLAGLLLLHEVIAAVAYLSWPTFQDHICAHFAVQAQVLLAGGDLYTALDAADRSSMLYGPTGYLANAAIMAWTADPILGAKLSGALLGLGTLIVLATALGRLGGLRAVLAGVAYCMLLDATFFFNFSTWNRSDSLIVFGTTLAYAATLTCGGRIGLAVAALGAGLAAGAKITAALAFLPLAWLVLRRRGGLAFGTWAAASTSLTVLPFALPGVSLVNYLSWLRAVSAHELSADLAASSLQFAGRALLMPLVIGLTALATRVRRGFLSDLRGQVLGLLVLTLILLILPASKEGAGEHHLLPLIPALAILTAWSLQGLDGARRLGLSSRQTIALVLVGFLWTGLVGKRALRKQAAFWRELATQSEAADVRSDLEAIRHRYPDRILAMGYDGGRMHQAPYRRTFLRPLLRSGDNFLDGAALMDAQAAGLRLPEATRARMRSQTYDIFLIPIGDEPFSMTNEYVGHQHTPLFEDLGSTFQESYRRIETTEFFEVWAARNRRDKARAGSPLLGLNQRH